MAELDRIDRAVPRGATIGICAESNGDWGLHAWFQRRFAASLDAVEGDRREWFLATNEAPRICVPKSCGAVTEPSRALVLMKCTPADPR
jgi:hypothetical protein